MKLLLDQDVYSATVRFLRKTQHDVITASDIGCSRAEDVELLHRSHEMRRVFVTRDKDFGRLVFLQDQAAGIIFLRVSPSNLADVHNELALVLEQYSQEVLLSAFVVIDSRRHRIRTVTR